jgi:drug/metabolite transporter (DMT)-like permease
VFLAAIPFAGELAGLATASCWATCSLAFAVAGRRIGAAAVNQLRMPIVVVLLGAAHLIAFGGLWPDGITPVQVFWLALSGFIGIALGDLCIFHCLALIGPRVGELVLVTAPVVTAVLAWPVLGETLGVQAVLGITVTIAGVGLVLADRCSSGAWRSCNRRRTEGIIAGLLGAVGQGTGLVLAKLGMNAAGTTGVVSMAGLEGQAGPLNPLSATLLRVMAGAIGVWGLALLSGHTGGTLKAMRSGRALHVISIGAALGLLGTWLSLVSVSYTKAGIGATLMAISPILVVPIAYFAYGDRPGRPAIGGTLVAVLGVACLCLAD